MLRFECFIRGTPETRMKINVIEMQHFLSVVVVATLFSRQHGFHAKLKSISRQSIRFYCLTSECQSFV